MCYPDADVDVVAIDLLTCTMCACKQVAKMKHITGPNTGIRQPHGLSATPTISAIFAMTICRELTSCKEMIQLTLISITMTPVNYDTIITKSGRK